MEVQSSPSEQALQFRDEFTPEHLAEHADWKEEVSWRMYPARTVRADTAGRNNAVNMRMMLQVLSPRMQDAQKADPSSQILRIGGDLEQRSGACTEKKIVERLLVLQHECR